MIRWPFNLLTVASMLLCLGVIACWVRVEAYQDALLWSDADGPGTLIRLDGSGLSILHAPAWPIRGHLSHFSAPLRSNVNFETSTSSSDGFAGLEFQSVQVSLRISPGASWKPFGPNEGPSERMVPAGLGWRLTVPLYILLVLSALLPAAWVAVHIRRDLRSERRQRDGCCPRCGYDLRASNDRCPECGNAIR